VGRALSSIGVDDLGERWGVHDVLERVGASRSLAAVVSRAVRLAIVAVIVIAALSLLGLQFLSESLNRAVLFVPNILVALALVLAGIVVGQLARRSVDRLTFQMDLPLPLGRVVEIGVIAAFAVTAAAQLALSVIILVGFVSIVLAAVALTFALSFGLGGRAVAQQLSAGRYVSGSFEVGQTVTVEGIRGRVEKMEPTVTVLRTSAGDAVRVPNHLMIERMVTVHADAAGAS
ncbi:MAG: mechanosensitive ion channel domain-containing protein, partial [Solirubrobacteraceae bacterium]